jgi:hypothetical protein
MAFLGGLLLGLVVDTHPNGAAFFPLVGLVYPLRLGWQAFLHRRVTWIFLAGIVAAALYYLSVRFLPDPAGFVTALGYWVGVDKAPPAVRAAGGLGAKLGAMVLNEIARYQDYFGEEPLELLVILLGLAGGLWMALRGSYPARLFWLGLLFAAAFFVVAVSTKSKYYMLLTYPLYLLLLARVLERVAAWVASRTLTPRPAARRKYRLRCRAKHDIRGPQGRHPLPVRGRGGDHRPVAGLLPLSHGRESGSGGEGFRVAIGPTVLAILVVVVMIWPFKLEDRAWDNFIRARRYREGQDYLELTGRLKVLAGRGARVMAPPVYWIGMHDHPYSDIFVYERVERQYGMTPAQFLDEIRPDLVITDAKIATERRVERLLYDELDSRAKYDLIVRHKNYGDVAVYRLTWPDTAP